MICNIKNKKERKITKTKAGQFILFILETRTGRSGCKKKWRKIFFAQPPQVREGKKKYEKKGIFTIFGYKKSDCMY
jgi:hypothetical protein